MRGLSLLVTIIIGLLLPISLSAQTGLADYRYEAFKDKTYVSAAAPHAQQTLDIYVPKTRSLSDAPLPVHVYVHGGAWTAGDKRLSNAKDIRAYTSQGIILVSVNYRLGPQHVYPANINDLQAASLWIAQNIAAYGGDPSNMVLSGHSAGAHLISLAELEANKNPRSAGSIYKAIFPIDTASFDLTQPATGMLSRLINRAKTSVFGDQRKDLIKASPIHQVRRKTHYAPMHIYVTAQRPDAAAQSQDFAKALTDKGHAASVTIIDDKASHADMRDKLFTAGSQIHHAIVAALSPLK